MQSTIEVEPMVSPSGYRIVRIGWPKEGEKYVSNSGKVATASAGYDCTKRVKVIVEAIDYTQWQEPIGSNADYPLPVGTRIEIDLPEGAITAVVDDEEKTIGANATIGYSGGGDRVIGYAQYRWRVVSDAPAPTQRFNIGDWVWFSDRIHRYACVREVYTEDDGFQYRFQFAKDGSWFTGDGDDAKKITFRPFTSAAEFAPHRQRWVRMVDDKTTFIRSVSGYSDGCITGNGWAANYDRAAKEFVFHDTGLPVGVEVE